MEKPKRKLPDPEKFIKKPTLPVTTVNRSPSQVGSNNTSTSGSTGLLPATTPSLGLAGGQTATAADSNTNTSQQSPDDHVEVSPTGPALSTQSSTSAMPPIAAQPLHAR